MCGIVGYIGNKIADKELVDTLKNLEYRGYDSAGVAYQINNSINTIKAEGKISNLEDILKGEPATCGIAHTRWATHGRPTVTNAHPHVSTDKTWAVVHNGIIENYKELKNAIEDKVNFVSQTDTEVIPQLLQVNSKNSAIDTFIDTCNALQGSFAIACMNKNIPNTLFLAKRKSPIFVCKNNNEVYVASDPICFAGKTKLYYTLDEDEFCIVSDKNIIFYNKNKTVITKKQVELNSFEESAGKGSYEHFMIKEIEENPQVIERIAQEYDSKNILSTLNLNLDNFNKVILVGCGTAYHASLMGAKYIEKLARIEARAYQASEFRYSNPIIDNKTLFIFVSQSGETADTLAALELAKSNGCITLGLTNVLYSTLAKKVDLLLPTCAGREIAVASTKAYTAQISILYIFARYLQNLKFKTNQNYLDKLRHLGTTLKKPDLEQLKNIANELADKKFAFFIGRDLDYVSCEEASLKLKEITYIHTSANPSGELKHGFISLIEDNTYLFVIATNKDLLDKTLNGAHEAFARGAKIILVSQLDIPENSLDFVYKHIKLQNFDENLMPIVSIIPFQYLSYFTSIKKGNNPDQPRNLAKSVTVE